MPWATLDSYRSSWVALAAMCCACSSAIMPAGDGSRDALDITSDTIAPETGSACTTMPANSQYCAMNGCAFRPVALPRCDGTGDYSFYGPDFCNASATVLLFVAGSSVPCMQEAAPIESRITEAYAARGVRVLTIYVQNPDGSTPTAEHCLAWQSGAERPWSTPRESLTCTMLLDPNGLSELYGPVNAFPLHLLVDEHGRIVDSLFGDVPLAGMVAEIDDLLASEGR